MVCGVLGAVVVPISVWRHAWCRHKLASYVECGAGAEASSDAYTDTVTDTDANPNAGSE